MSQPVRGMVFPNAPQTLQTRIAKENNPIALPPPVVQAGLPAHIGSIAPQAVAIGLLLTRAAGRAALNAGKVILGGYALEKAVDKLDEGLGLIEPKSHREQRLLDQLNHDQLRNHVLDLMADTEHALVNPQIPINQRVQKIRDNYDMALSIIAHNLGDHARLSEDEHVFIRWCADKTEKALSNLWGLYDSAKDVPQIDGQQDQLYSQIANQLDQISQVTAGLGYIQQKIEKASESMQTAISEYRKERNPQIAVSKMNQYLAAAEAGFILGGLIAEISGNHQLAQKIVSGGQAVITVAKSATAITSAVSASLTTVFPHYVLIATAIYSLISLFSRSQKQEQAMLTSIMQQLNTLSKQVQQLHIDLHARFSHLIDLLHDHHLDTMIAFAGLAEQNRVTVDNLQELGKKIDNDSLRIFQYAQEIYAREFQDCLAALQRYSNMYGKSHTGDISQFSKQAETFYLWAVSTAKNPALFTDSITCAGRIQEITDADISKHLGAIPWEGNIRFLTEYAAQFDPFLKRDQVNIFEWLRSSNAYLHLRNMFPNFSQFDPKGESINEMISCGLDRLMLSKQLQKNRTFFGHLCQNYNGAVENSRIAIQQASFEFVKTPREQLNRKFASLTEALQHERQGSPNPQSQLAKYGHPQTSLSYTVERHKKLKRWTLDYEQYVTKLQERLAICESAFLSMWTEETFSKFLEAPCSLQLTSSPSLIILLQGLPFDLHGLFEIPQAAFVAELLGLGRINIDIKIVEDHEQEESAVGQGSPFKKGRYLKSYRRFEIQVGFIGGVSGHNYPILTAQSKPLFFPGNYWIRNTIKGASEPSKKTDQDKQGVPKKWGKKEHEKKWVQRYGDVGEALSAGHEAYLLKNFEHAKKEKLFSVKYEPDVLQYFENHIKFFQKNLNAHLIQAIRSPSTRASQYLSNSVTSLDACQKLLKAYCCLAFPKSSVSDLICIHALSSPKELWSKVEIEETLQRNTYSATLQQLANLRPKTDAFYEHLNNKIDVLQKNEVKAEQDPNIENMILRLVAYRSEKYKPQRMDLSSHHSSSESSL